MKTEVGQPAPMPYIGGIITGRMPRLQPGLSRRSVAKTDLFCVALKHLPITMQKETREQ